MIKRNIYMGGLLGFFAFLLFSSLSVAANTYVSDVYAEYLIESSPKSITVNLEGASLESVLKAISNQAGLNFIASQKAKDKKLTLYLKNVPLKKALDVIFKANNLTYDFYPESKIFVVKEVKTPEVKLITKVYRLKYARLKDSRLQKEIDNTFGKGYSTESSNSSSSNNEEDDKGIKYEIEQIISEYGKVTEDVRSNSLIVMDIPSQFPLIDKTIKELDKPLPKVLIEVEMLDVNKDVVDKLGFNNLGENPFTLVFHSKGSHTNFFVGNLANRGMHLDTLSSGGSVILGTSFASLLDFLTTQTDTKALARPKILTLSNETAEIKISANEAIGVKKSVNNDTGSEDYDIERAETGVILKVTPHVDIDTREIEMFVQPKVIEAKDSGLSIPGYLTGNLKNPEERSVSSILRIKEDETIMIGGLVRNDTTNTVKKVPFFGDIPFLGALLRGRDAEHEKRELLIFLTPHIVSDSSYQVPSQLTLRREQSSYLTSRRKRSINKALEFFSRY